jgi:hypothetical protein
MEIKPFDILFASIFIQDVPTKKWTFKHFCCNQYDMWKNKTPNHSMQYTDDQDNDSVDDINNIENVTRPTYNTKTLMGLTVKLVTNHKARYIEFYIKHIGDWDEIFITNTKA